jgi:hypothetical protein
VLATLCVVTAAATCSAGGPGAGAGGQPSVDACQGRSPHGFVDQEGEVAAGIARFIRGGSY